MTRTRPKNRLKVAMGWGREGAPQIQTYHQPENSVQVEAEGRVGGGCPGCKHKTANRMVRMQGGVSSTFMSLCSGCKKRTQFAALFVLSCVILPSTPHPRKKESTCSPAPGFVLDVKAQQVIQHVFPGKAKTITIKYRSWPRHVTVSTKG